MVTSTAHALADREKITMWLGFIILLIFALWAFADYDFALVISSLTAVDWQWVGVGIVLNVVLLYVRVFKWRFYHQGFKTFSFHNLCLAAFVAYTCNMVVPAKVGAFVQAWLLSKSEPIPVGSVLSTLLLVRVMDGISILFIGGMIVFFMDVPLTQNTIWDAYKAAGALLASLLFGVIGFLFWFQKNEKARDMLHRVVQSVLPGGVKKTGVNLLKSLWEGFAVLQQGRNIIVIVGLSFVFWGMASLMVWAYLKAFQIASVPFYAPLCIILAQAIGFMIPTPGYIGPFHAATVTALSFLGFSGELALSVAIVMHAGLFVTNILPGIIYLWTKNLNLFGVIKNARQDMDRS